MKRILIILLIHLSAVASAHCSNSDSLSIQTDLDNLQSLLETIVNHREADRELIKLTPMIMHIRSFYGNSRPQRSFRNRDNAIIDCFRTTRQPALRRFDNSYRRVESAPERRGNVSIAGDDRRSKCQSGEVPIPRLSLEVIREFDNLEAFLLKTPIPADGNTASLVGGVNHYYAAAIRRDESSQLTGARSNLNVWQPTVSNNEMSLSQLWLTNGSGSRLQTVESGWQVYPRKYRSKRPAVFIFYTPDNYSSGCYNLDCKAFVVLSNKVPIGQALPASMVSQTNDEQKEITLEWTLHSETGSWWLWYEDSQVKDWAGYYPKEIFNSGAITKAADSLQIGGEDTGEPQALQIGSGEFASQGYQKAAYQRDVRYRPVGEHGFVSPELSSSVVTEPCYTLDIFNSSKEDWYSYVYFGGPKCPSE